MRRKDFPQDRQFYFARAEIACIDEQKTVDETQEREELGLMKFRIEKLTTAPGRYLNSRHTLTWVEVGSIESPDIETAAIEACFIVGSSLVRLTPDPSSIEQ